MWWDIAIALGAGLLAAWLGLLITLLLIRPKGALLVEAIRLLPDLVRLLRRLAADKALPRGVRVRLGLLMVYLALPIDLIPDFLPVIGYADDAIIVVSVLRSVVRRAGIAAVRAHWPGTEDGFAALSRLAGLQRAADGTAATAGPKWR
ncbi:YkvA family protein [Streptomyces sp. NPDC001832]|uniref:YkvA family protein n=1 Tax=Streptomyces sp. NPDC001832 TaxID=3154527 RepID=UPI003329AC15